MNIESYSFKTNNKCFGVNLDIGQEIEQNLIIKSDGEVRYISKAYDGTLFGNYPEKSNISKRIEVKEAVELIELLHNALYSETWVIEDHSVITFIPKGDAEFKLGESDFKRIRGVRFVQDTISGLNLDELISTKIGIDNLSLFGTGNNKRYKS